MITISNCGKNIVATDFFNKKSTSFLVSVNNGAFRILLPKNLEYVIPEMKTGKYAIVSINSEWIEILFEDLSDSPFALHSTKSAIIMPLNENRLSNLTLSVWIEPCQKVFEIPCKLRKVSQIPNMQPWTSKDEKNTREAIIALKESKTMRKVRRSLQGIQGLIDFEKSYHKQLPRELERNYVYLKDCGHNIMCVLEPSIANRDIGGAQNLWKHEVPVPVKYVLEKGFREGLFCLNDNPEDEGVIFIDAPYSAEYGLLVDSSYDEF